MINRLTSNSEFEVQNGVPRQKKYYSREQSQTQDSFGFKWKKRDTYESPAVQDASRKWLLERYQVNGVPLPALVKGKRVLDAGCGAGHAALLLFGDVLNECDYVGVDISEAVDVAQARFRERGMNGEFIQASLTELPREIGLFDYVISEGVLHHTDSTEKAIHSLAPYVKPGGLFLFYVYRKKAPVREFVDDFLREKISKMSNEEAWKALEPLSQLGKILGDLNITLNIEKPIDILEIPAGKIDLQRFFYWYIMKAYYRPDWSLDELNHINFDWYRPTNSHRQTPEEVQLWTKAAGFKILDMKLEEAGITVVAQKPIE